jgi:hypothetical protein
MINIYSEKCIYCKAIENGISIYCRQIINGNSKEKKYKKKSNKQDQTLFIFTNINILGNI